jgi:membrane fusion protein, multidrug efflux system
VDVVIKNDQGGQLGAAPNTVYRTNVFEKYGDKADAEIVWIIQENEGSPGPGNELQNVPARGARPVAGRTADAKAPSTPSPPSRKAAPD